MNHKKFGFFFAFLLFLSSCTGIVVPGSSSSSTTVPPVYQGMTVQSVNQGLNQTRYQSVDLDNPFQLPINERIEARIQNELIANPIDDSLDYLARPSEKVRVTINLTNPQSFVILSFNLNGRRYQSFEFREGSNSTSLLMDVDLQSQPGIQELTIDEIKYVDGTDIKDVILFGETTVKVGISFSNLPSVLIQNQLLSQTSTEFEILSEDQDGLIANNSTPLYIFLFDGVQLLKEELVLGTSEILFDKLKSKNLYQYAIATVLNLLGGQGSKVYYFDKNIFQTTEFLDVNLTISKTSIDYAVQVSNAIENSSLSRVELWKDEVLVNSLTSSEGTFDSLLSNNVYHLKAHFDYAFDAEGEVLTETETIEALTLANTIPTFTFTDINPGKEEVTFEYSVEDPDQVGNLNKIELIKGDEVIETLTEFEDTTFNNLLSNNDYQLKATYTYDLNDGVGEQFITATNDIKTLSKQNPEFSFTNLIPSKESISFDYQVTDLDQVGGLIRIELVKEDVVLETYTSFDNLLLEGLLSNNQYVLKAYYEANFNDGLGIQLLVFSQEFSTLAKTTPTFTFTDVVTGKEEITFEYIVDDPDQVGIVSKIELLKGEEVVQTLTDFDETTFINLLSNNEYEIKATYTYDLNDGYGIQDLEISSPTKTLPKAVPNVTMRIENVFSTSIEIDLNFEDPDSTLLSFQTMLLNTEGVLVENKINDLAPIFFNLNSFTQYEIKLEYLYVNNETTENAEILNTEIRQIKTAPESITIDSVIYLTNNTIQINGEVLVQLTIDNPSSVDLMYVISGDNYFEVNKNLSSSEIVVFKYIDNTIGGQFTFKIDGFIFIDGQEEMELLPTNEFEFNIRVLGTISIIDLMVITNNQYINVVSEDSNSLIKIWLNNPSEYDVFSMVLQQTNIETLNDSQFEMSKDKQIITLNWTGSKQFQSYQGAYNVAFLVLRSLTYGFDEQSTSVINFEINHFVIRPIPIVPSLNPLPIYTYEDLISINAFGSYYLANDLDLINVNHSTPINFKGFFDGRGHTIKNLKMMNISSAISTNEVMLGLFGRIEGHFQNLVLENSNLYLDYKQPLFLGVFAGNMQKGNVFNIEIKGEHTIYAASNARINFGNLIGSLSDNGSLYASKVYGTYNTTIKSSSKLDDGRPRIGGIIGVNSGRSIESNILDATLNYNFEFVSHTDRYAVGYLFGGLSAVENGGEFAYNIVKGTINLIDNTTITNQTVNIGGMIARIGNKQSHNVFLAEMNIKTPGYLTVSGFYGHAGSLNFVHNFIFGGKITIQAGQRENWGYILPYQASATKVFNNNYILDGASITNVTNDSDIAKVILSGNLPNNYNVPYFQIDSFSTANGLEINQLNFTHFSIIISIIESINLIDENTTQEIIDSIKAEISQLSEYEKSLVYNKALVE
jgi:hypothetical protein